MTLTERVSYFFIYFPILIFVLPDRTRIDLSSLKYNIFSLCLCVSELRKVTYLKIISFKEFRVSYRFI